MSRPPQDPKKDKLIGKQNCLTLLPACDMIDTSAQFTNIRFTPPLMGLLIGLARSALGQRLLNIGNVRANEFCLIGQQLVSIDYPSSIFGA